MCVCVLPCTYMANAFYGIADVVVVVVAVATAASRSSESRTKWSSYLSDLLTVAAVDPTRTSATGSYIILFELLDDACRLG